MKIRQIMRYINSLVCTRHFITFPTFPTAFKVICMHIKFKYDAMVAIRLERINGFNAF